MDELVASAIAHWGPRFTINGVTVSDFERVTGRVERWADWCAAWSDMGGEHEALGRQALAEGRLLLGRRAPRRRRRSTTTSASSSSSRTSTRCAPRTSAPSPASTDALPHLDPPGRRIEIPFEGTPAGRRAPRCPDGERAAPGRRPAVRAGLHQGGAALHRGDLPRPRPGDLHASTAPARARRSTTCRSAATGRPPAEAIMGDARATCPRSTAAGSPSGASASAATTRRGSPPRSATGSRACVALAGPFDFGECWDAAARS